MSDFKATSLHFTVSVKRQDNNHCNLDKFVPQRHRHRGNQRPQVLDQSPAQPNTPCAYHMIRWQPKWNIYIYNIQWTAFLANETAIGVPGHWQPQVLDETVYNLGNVTTNGYYGTFKLHMDPAKADSYHCLRIIRWWRLIWTFIRSHKRINRRSSPQVQLHANTNTNSRNRLHHDHKLTWVLHNNSSRVSRRPNAKETTINPKKTISQNFSFFYFFK